VIVSHAEVKLSVLQAGMYQNIGNINVTGVLFDSNIATGSGGGLYQNSFAGSVQNCTFTNNRVGGSGGGLFQNDYRGNVAACVFNTNSARSGGAIYQNAATGMTSNSTFDGNGAEKGGAIYQVKGLCNFGRKCCRHKDMLSWLDLVYLLLHIFQYLTNMHADVIDSLHAGCRTTARMPT
jgi:predicted outer membrane repeat protein